MFFHLDSLQIATGMGSRSSSTDNLTLDHSNTSSNDLNAASPVSPSVSVGELMEILPISR